MIKYSRDKKAVFAQLQREVPELQEISDESLKSVFLVIYHGGSHLNHFDKLGLPSDHEPLKLLELLEKTIRETMGKLMDHSSYRETKKKIIQLQKPNVLGTFTSWVWQQEENKIIQALAVYLKEKERLKPGVLTFDGVMVERTTDSHSAPLDGEVLRRCENFVKEELDFDIVLVEKSLIPRKEDWERYWGEKALHKIPSDEAKQNYLLAREGQKNKLKRASGWVMKPHEQIPGVFCRVEEDSDFINRVLKDCHYYSRSASMTNLQKWFNHIDHPMFELLTPMKMSRSVISFLNGYLDLEDLSFVYWDDVKTPPLTNWYFEQVLDMSDIDKATPLWDNLLETQLGKRSENPVADFFEVMTGRLFYPVGEFDNWQVMPFLLGDGNTGKGTICDLIKLMFPAGSVGVITATHEATFGLEGLYDKQLVISPDIPKKFSKVVNQSDFQSMVTGEGVSVARKNKPAITGQDWLVPMLGAGNYLFDYKDSSGSISRRVVVFLFATLVNSRNTTLKSDIRNKELVTVMLRCLKSYRRTCSRYGSADFWTQIAPQSLREVQMDVKEETNYLANFLANGDDYYQIQKVVGEITPLDALEKAYSNHMKIKHKELKTKIGDDKFPIKAAGYTLERENLCKSCHKKASKESCGDHYSDKNRYRKWVVHDMKIVTRDY
jgi:hypothetical protein